MVNEANSRIPVTGMAWTTALGDQLQSVWQRLLNGETGIISVPSKYELRNLLAASINEIDRKLPVHQRLHEMSIHTIHNAISNSPSKSIDENTWLVIGTSFGSRLDEPDTNNSLHEWADHIAREFSLQDRCISLSTACSSGSDAIVVAAELIRTGKASTVICGGVDILTESKRIAHSELGTMSPTHLRSFDQRHDGTLLGEGVGFIILESDEHNATQIHGYLAGHGSANDGAGLTAPDDYGRGASTAIERSLRDAGITANDINLINAHGSGTPVNDSIELQSLKTVFKKSQPLVFATKGAFGHTLGATGALETIILLLALKEQAVPPIVGLEIPDPNFCYPLAMGKATPCKAQYGLNVTLGFGGFDTSLVFEANNENN